MPRRTALLAAVVAGLAVAPAAVAHVSVLPTTAVTGESTEFTIRVPAEEDLTTTQVRVAFPKEITVYAVSDAPGWATRVIVRANGRLGGVVWSGGSIAPDRYYDFTVLGTPVGNGTAAWAAWQTTSSGAVKRWTGPPEQADDVATETSINAPGPSAGVAIVATPADAAPAANSNSSGSGLWLGVIAIAVSLAALAGVGLIWASRPRDLPPDGPEDRA